MKTFLKFSGLISLVLAVVAFILMLATNAVVVKSGNLQVVYSGGQAIFGWNEQNLLGQNVHYNGAPLALISWILALAALLIILLGLVLPLFKVKALERFAGILNLVAVCCLVLAGIFVFPVVPNFYAANGWDVPEKAAIGGGWLIAGIIYIVAGAIAICPAVADFLGKKK